MNCYTRQWRGFLFSICDFRLAISDLNTPSLSPSGGGVRTPPDRKWERSMGRENHRLSQPLQLWTLDFRLLDAKLTPCRAMTCSLPSPRLEQPNRLPRR